MRRAGAAGAFVALSLASTLSPGRPGDAQSAPALDRHLPQPVDRAERMTVVTVVRGHGSPARAGDSIRIRYRGPDARGGATDDARDEGSIEFVLGAGEVIAGLDEGLAGIKVGEKRKLVIPPAMAYGPYGWARMPASGALVYEIERLALLGEDHDD
jgi:FKBP-type peptidyl-prolyl cis-trans isomerase FkpA